MVLNFYEPETKTQSKNSNNVNKAPNLYCILNLGYMTNYGDEIPLSGCNPLNC